MQCQFCNSLHDGLYGKGKFCSRKCQMRFVASLPRKKRQNHSPLKGKKTTRIKQENLVCEICGKNFSNFGLPTHMWRMHGEGKNHKAGKKIGSIAWNKGLSKITDERVAKSALSWKENFSFKIEKGISVSRTLTESQRKAISLRQSHHNSGGKCKWFDVGGQKVQGTWEKNVAELMNFLNISWIKKSNSIISIFHGWKRKNVHT